MKALIDLAERGLIPDRAVRAGIRSLVRKRLHNEEDGGCEAQLDRKNDFVLQLQSSPIALNTDKANQQHYEVPAPFFEAFLGPYMKYSSGLWPEGVTCLEACEEAMLQLTCRHAHIEDGMTVLDLGCGWGSLSLWIAKKFPSCRVLAVSNSRAQRRFIRDRCATMGLVNLEVKTADMNSFDPIRTFDRVVTVEMFEHMRNWPELYRRIASWLEPDGLMFQHVFCHRTHAYPYVNTGSDDWMTEHFFTGGMMPSDDLPYRFSDHLKVSNHWRINGRHYSRTLEAWLQRMDDRRDQIVPLFRAVYGPDADRWFHRWRIFFMACSELFALNGGNEWWVSHYRLERARPAAVTERSRVPIAAPATVDSES